jgi:hypothetical protein
MHSRIFMGLALTLLSGCVSEKAVLTNNAGQAVHCDHWGFGIIGAPVAMAQHSDCVKKAQEAGYSETPLAPASPASASAVSHP